jgi:hypothetical protein|tara:strand:+ start:381 stop:605 length:225 start_codon:yes stop_codon:yes gene_type:complete
MIDSDWRYSDERMNLRQDVFLKLKHHLNLSEIQFLYEFCHTWVSQGNTSTDNLEEEFSNFLLLNEKRIKHGETK